MQSSWKPMQHRDNLAGELSRSQMLKRHLPVSSHLPAKPAGLQESGWAGTWSMGLRAHGWEVLCSLPLGKCFVSTGAAQREQRLEAEEQPYLANPPSMPIQCCQAIKGWWKHIPKAHHLCKAEPEGVLALSSCVLTTDERLLYWRQTPSCCFPHQNLNISAC